MSTVQIRIGPEMLPMQVRVYILYENEKTKSEKTKSEKTKSEKTEVRRPK